LVRNDPGGLAIWLQPAGGGEARKLVVVPGGGACLRWAPDGASIGLLAVVGEGKLAFWRISYPGGEARRTMQAVSTLRGPRTGAFSWFPDGRHIVFSGALERVGLDHLLRADTRSGAVQPLTPALDDEADPSLSPDGRRIAFTLRDNPAEIVGVPLDGSPFRSVLAESLRGHCAAWSPKGDQFVYVKEHNGADEVWLYNKEGHWERPLVNAASFHEGPTDRVTEPRFSPDGQRVAFSRVAGGNYSLWLVNAAGGPPVPLGVDHAMTAVFSPDGNWIAYNTMAGGKWGLAKIAAGGTGKPIQLVPAGSNHLLRTQWSPDGNWFTWLSNDGLEIVSADGSRKESLADETGWQQTAGFSKDGSEVVGIRENDEHHYYVEAIDIHSKRKRVILDMGPQAGTHSFSMAPDGKSFLTTLHRYRGDIWMLEGFPQP